MDILTTIKNRQPATPKMRRVKRWQIIRDGRGSQRIYDLRTGRRIVARYNRLHGEECAYLSSLMVWEVK